MALPEGEVRLPKGFAPCTQEPGPPRRKPGRGGGFRPMSHRIPPDGGGGDARHPTAVAEALAPFLQVRSSVPPGVASYHQQMYGERNVSTKARGRPRWNGPDNAGAAAQQYASFMHPNRFAPTDTPFPQDAPRVPAGPFHALSFPPHSFHPSGLKQLGQPDRPGSATPTSLTDPSPQWPLLDLSGRPTNASPHFMNGHPVDQPFVPSSRASATVSPFHPDRPVHPLHSHFPHLPFGMPPHPLCGPDGRMLPHGLNVLPCGPDGWPAFHFDPTTSPFIPSSMHSPALAHPSDDIDGAVAAASDSENVGSDPHPLRRRPSLDTSHNVQLSLPLDVTASDFRDTRDGPRGPNLGNISIPSAAGGRTGTHNTSLSAIWAAPSADDSVGGAATGAQGGTMGYPGGHMAAGPSGGFGIHGGWGAPQPYGAYGGGGGGGRRGGPGSMMGGAASGPLHGHHGYPPLPPHAHSAAVGPSAGGARPRGGLLEDLSKAVGGAGADDSGIGLGGLGMSAMGGFTAGRTSTSGVTIGAIPSELLLETSDLAAEIAAAPGRRDRADGLDKCDSAGPQGRDPRSSTGRGGAFVPTLRSAGAGLAPAALCGLGSGPEPLALADTTDAVAPAASAADVSVGGVLSRRQRGSGPHATLSAFEAPLPAGIAVGGCTPTRPPLRVDSDRSAVPLGLLQSPSCGNGGSPSMTAIVGGGGSYEGMYASPSGVGGLSFSSDLGIAPLNLTLGGALGDSMCHIGGASPLAPPLCGSPNIGAGGVVASNLALGGAAMAAGAVDGTGLTPVVGPGSSNALAFGGSPSGSGFPMSMGASMGAVSCMSAGSGTGIGAGLGLSDGGVASSRATRGAALGLGGRVLPSISAASPTAVPSPASPDRLSGWPSGLVGFDADESGDGDVLRPDGSWGVR